MSWLYRALRPARTFVAAVAASLGVLLASVAFSAGPVVDTSGQLAADNVWPNTTPVAISASLGRGFWLVTAEGAVYSYEGAQYFGGANGVALHSPIVDLVGTPTGEGYWLVAADGGVFTFGDALFAGSAAGLGDVVAGASTASGAGYWLVTSSGQVRAFGDAADFGSLDIGSKIIDIVATPGESGYTLIGADGGTFTFGTAPFLGSAVGQADAPIVAAVPEGAAGLWLISQRGTVYPLGTAAPRPPIVTDGSSVGQTIVSGDGAGFRALSAPLARLANLAPLPADTGNGKRVVYSNIGQQVWLVDANNAVVRTFRVSGKQGVPRPGNYSIISQSRRTNSTINPSIWMRNMSRFIPKIGFHEIPIRVSTPMQTLDELGQYRSHGCVRLAPEDAAFLYDWVDVGTPVIVPN